MLTIGACSNQQTHQKNTAGYIHSSSEGVPVVLPTTPKWTLQSSTSIVPSTLSTNNLMGVSCVKSNLCIAVGYARNISHGPSNGATRDYALEWNGARWNLNFSSKLSVRTSTSSYLAAVSCPAVSFCAAVGGFNYGYSTGQNLLALKYGTKWKLVTSSVLSSSRAQDNFMSGISCPTTTLCFASGGYTDASGAVQSLLLRWQNGKLTKFDSPALSTSPSQYNDLINVSCTSASFCVAAGVYYDGKTRQSIGHNLVLAWNGSTWSRTPVPDGGPQGSAINWVSCAASTFCVAAGGFFNGSAGRNFLLVFNGTTWLLDSSPQLSTSPNQTNGFNSISCISKTYCVAAGNYLVGQTEQNFISTFNGTTWLLDSSPQLSTSPTQASLLNSIDCAPSGACMAVGNYFDGPTPSSGIGRDFAIDGP